MVDEHRGDPQDRAVHCFNMRPNPVSLSYGAMVSSMGLSPGVDRGDVVQPTGDQSGCDTHSRVHTLPEARKIRRCPGMKFIAPPDNIKIR